MIRPWELEIAIDQAAGKAVYLQIADAIIGAIKSGKLAPGAALPGSRQLASKLGVNRNTIVEAQEVLLNEGWIFSRERSGTFVSTDLPSLERARNRPAVKPATAAQPVKPRIVFDDGFPDSRIAPIRELSRAYRQILERSGRWHLLGYTTESGDHAFKTAIVQMLNFTRGMRLSTDEICITRGSQMAMFLTAHCLLKPGDIVAVENPGYRPAWQAFQHAGAVLVPVDVDEQGLLTDQLQALLKSGKRIRAVYTTPHHQFPTTVTLSLQRRLELIALSNRYGFTIIEDDYDNEFHFGQRPILPLCSADNTANFVYIGSMSKVVAPALRIGYLAATKPFVTQVGELRKLIDVQGDPVMERALLQLIDDGEIRRHLKRATAFYRKKRDVFEQLLHRHLGDKVSFIKPDGGLAFWLTPARKNDFKGLAARLSKLGIRIVPPTHFSFDESPAGLRLGYASLPEELQEEGIAALAKCI